MMMLMPKIAITSPFSSTFTHQLWKNLTTPAGFWEGLGEYCAVDCLFHDALTNHLATSNIWIAEQDGLKSSSQPCHPSILWWTEECQKSVLDYIQTPDIPLVTTSIRNLISFKMRCLKSRAGLQVSRRVSLMWFVNSIPHFIDWKFVWDRFWWLYG
jgi:hypothetical protein